MLDNHEPPPLDSPEEEEDAAELVRLTAISKANDLRAGLIHEYAHFHVAKHYRLEADIEITPNPDGDFGRTHFICKCQVQLSNDPSIRRIVGLAGTCAEMLACEPRIGSCLAASLFARDERRLSEKDASAAGEFKEEDIHACLALLRELWPAITVDVDRWTSARAAGSLDAAT